MQGERTKRIEFKNLWTEKLQILFPAFTVLALYGRHTFQTSDSLAPSRQLPPSKAPFASFYDMKDELWPKEPHEREYSHQFTQILRKNATIALPVYFFLLASNAQILPSVRKRISIVF